MSKENNDIPNIVYRHFSPIVGHAKKAKIERIKFILIFTTQLIVAD